MLRVNRERERMVSGAIISRGVSHRSVGVIMVCGTERFREATSLF